MKWASRFFYLMLLVAVLSMPVYLDHKSNGQFLGIENFMDRVASLPQRAMALFKGEADSGITSGESEPVAQTDSGEGYYRWQDDKGRWHFSDEKPEGVLLEKIVPEPVMTMPALTTEKTKPAQPALGRDITQLHIDPLSVDAATNVMENAKAAAAMMEQRQEALREIVGEE